MSYDLWFWKQTEDCQASPEAVIDALGHGRDVPGIQAIDIGALLSRIRETFPEIEAHHHPDTGELRQLILDPPDQDWMILLGWSDTHLSVESGSAPGEILNQFIDLASEFECPLYDPQTETRYVEKCTTKPSTLSQILRIFER